MSRTLLLLVAVASAFAQPTGDAESPQRLVKFNVAVTNAQDDPITDLRASDIQVREDGKVRPVVFFRFESVDRATLPPTVILFDRWNEQIGAAAPAWIELGSALQHMESVERIFIYFLTNQGDVYPVYPLPATGADLRTMIEPTPAELRAKLDEAVRKLSGLRNHVVADPFLRVKTTLQALNALDTQIAYSIAGRKNLIWVTQGIPLGLPTSGHGWLDYTPFVRSLSADAARSQIAIYTVEAQGAVANLTSSSMQTLQMFAALTGGRWYASDNAARALAGAIADSRGSYRVAYYSATREKDRKERKIGVESSRKDVRLLTREGYFVDDAEPDPGELEQVMFTSERRSPFEATEIGLRVAQSMTPSGRSSRLAIHVDPADVLLEPREGNYRGQLALQFTFYSQGFPKEAWAPIAVDVDLTQDQFNKAQKDWIDISQDIDFPVSGDIQKIRVIVFDHRLYALGSVTVSLLK